MADTRMLSPLRAKRPLPEFCIAPLATVALGRW